MLVLSRKTGQKLVIDGKITIVVNRVAGNRVSLGIEAPPDVHVVRGELKPFVDEFRDDESLVPCGVEIDSNFELAMPIAAR